MTLATKRPAGRISSIWAGVRSSITVGTLRWRACPPSVTSSSARCTSAPALDERRRSPCWTGSSRRAARPSTPPTATRSGSPTTGHGGQSEAVIGRWLAANPGLRERLVIATKVGVEPDDDGGLEGLSADVIQRESALSLDRLGVDLIDVYWAHGEDRATDLEETVDRVRRAGQERPGRSPRRLQPPHLAGGARPPARGPPVGGAVDRAAADHVVRRAAAGRRRARQGPPVRLRLRRDPRLRREPPRARAVGLQPAGPGRLRPGRPAASPGLRPPRHHAPASPALARVAERHGVAPSPGGARLADDQRAAVAADRRGQHPRAAGLGAGRRPAGAVPGGAAGLDAPR